MLKTTSEETKIKKKTFKKRSGTTDQGKDYENLLLVHLICRLIKDDVDFHLWSNDKVYGAFDDVILETENFNCAVQLKHVAQNDKNLAIDSLQASKGNFSIKKYFETYRKDAILRSCDLLVLFTNCKTNANQELELKFDEDTFKVTFVEVPVNEMVNTNGKNYTAFQFKIADKTVQKYEEYESFFQKFRLYDNQLNAEELHRQVCQEIQQRFCCTNDVVEKFVSFFTKWNLVESFKETLNKAMMKRLISLHLMGVNIQPLSFKRSDRNRRILETAIMNFHVTTFDAVNVEVVTSMWLSAKKQFHLAEGSKTNKNYQISINKDINPQSLSDEDCTKLLWLMGKCPLVVTATNPAVYEGIKLCTDRNFILVGGSIDVPAFRKLSDLNSFQELRQEVLQRFSCLVCEKELSLQYLDLEEVVTTNDLLLMLDSPYKIKRESEELPAPYISRDVSKQLIHIKFLDVIDKDTLVLVSNVKPEQSKKYLKKYQPVDVESKEIGRTQVFTSKESGANKFDEICGEKRATAWYHFKLVEGKLELLGSRPWNGVSKVYQYCVKTDVVEEDELFHEGYGNTNVLIGDSGLGKSWLLQSLKAKIPAFCILFGSSDMKKICAFLKNNSEEQLDEYILELKYPQPEFDRRVAGALGKKNEVVYLWDAIDEVVSNSNRKIIFEVIQKFAQRGIVQFIASRCHLKNTLETQFGVLSQTLLEFNEAQQNQYIEQRLQSVCSTRDALNRLKVGIVNNIAVFRHKDILSTPLQIYMMTEICTNDPTSIDDLSKGVFSLAKLYEDFVDKKLRFHYKKKPEYDWDDFEDKKSGFISRLETAAARAVLDTDHLTMLHFDVEEITYSSDRFGFVTEIIVDTTPTIKFAHISFAEYFLACRLARLKVYNFKFIFEEKYKNVRFFFDMVLAENCPVHMAVLCGNLSELTKHEDKIQCKDAAGRNPLQLACSWGSTWKMLHFKYKQGRFHLSLNQCINQENPGQYLDLIEFLVTRCDSKEVDHNFAMSAVDYAVATDSTFALALLDGHESTYLLDYHIKLLHCFDKWPKLFASFFQRRSLQINRRLSTLYYAVKFDLEKFVLLLKADINRVVIGPNEHTLLHLACKSGDRKTVRLLLETGADLKATTKTGHTPLQLACGNPDEEVVKFLIDAKVDVNASNTDGKLLASACRNCNQEILKLLIEAGIDVNTPDEDGTTPMILACKHDQDVVKVLQYAGADVNASDKDGNTPLIFATKNGKKDVITFLLSKGADINAVDGNGNSALFFACGRGKDVIVKLLVDNGADVNAVNAKGETPLMLAVRNGTKETVYLLIQNGANVKASYKNGTTVLMLACKDKHHNIVAMLIDAGADVNASDDKGNTPLIIASIKNYKKVVDCLLKNNADVNGSNKLGVTPLISACRNNSENVVDILLDSKAKVNGHPNPLVIACKTCNKKLIRRLLACGAEIDSSDPDVIVMFIFACEDGNEALVRRLLKEGVDVNGSYKEGTTPLISACRSGQEKIVRILLKAKADVKAPDIYGTTPLIASCKKDNDTIVQLLIPESDVNASDRKGNNALIVACKFDREAAAKLLLEAHADINTSNCMKETPLICACRSGNAQLVDFLLKNHADVNASDSFGNKPFNTACRMGKQKVVELLVNLGAADINAPNKFGTTPLLSACYKGHDQIFKYLLDQGADPNAVDDSGNSPLLSACRRGKISMVKDLLNAGSDIKVCDLLGKTPLISACMSGNDEVVKTMIKAGSDVRAADQNGNTSLHWACRNASRKIVECLLEEQVDVNASNKQGVTPIMDACKQKRFDCELIEMLFKAGADIYAFDNKGNTPLRILYRTHREEVIKKLELDQD